MRRFLPYAVSVTAVALCALAGLALGGVTRGPAPLIILLLAVAIAAWFGAHTRAKLADENRAHQKLVAELEESRRRLHLAYESSQSGSFEFDPRTGLSTWSPELERLYGMEPGTYRGTTAEWAARVHPEDIERAQRDIALAMEGGAFMSHWRIVLPDGRVRHVQAQGKMWLDAEGKPERMSGVNIDVTERREAELRLMEAESSLDVALAAARMGRWHMDLVTGVLESSNTCKANFGRKPHEPLTYEDVVAAVHPDDRERMQESVRRAIAEKRDYAVEYRVIWPDGTERWIAARGRALFEGDRPVTMDGVTIDFTARKRLEEDLERKTISLQDADRRKDQFLAMLGHELRNPLAPMRSAVEILRNRGAEADTRERMVGILDRQVAQIATLVNELMDVSRIAQGKVRLEREMVPVQRVVDEAMEASEPLMASRQHTVRATLPEAPIFVHADRARLVQVLTNLLNNAAKYTDPGGHIEVIVRGREDSVVIDVRDNGIGIAAEAQPYVFELFAQVEGAAERSMGGLGLGLNVARRLVEMHGGTLVMASAGAGKGSTFTVALPLATKEVVAPA